MAIWRVTVRPDGWEQVLDAGSDVEAKEIALKLFKLEHPERAGAINAVDVFPADPPRPTE